MHAATLSLPSSTSATLQRLSAAVMGRQGAASPSVDSHELLRGQKAVEIMHNGSVYRLQTTKLGKLILTK
jgi:hemin uptake protein HemP